MRGDVRRERRRVEIVNATWRIIARKGIEHATMREIAAEAGLANGALKPYFPAKDDLLTAAFEHVFNRTNERIAASVSGKRGLSALVALCREVLPLDEERVNEARIVVPFWQNAMTDQDKVRFHAESLDQWRTAIVAYLEQARQAGEITSPVRSEDVAEQLLTLMVGAQVLAALSDHAEPPGRFDAQLHSYLELLGAQRPGDSG